MVDDDDAAFILVGEFIRRARLTPKAVRVYERAGLLRPASIDPATGYRRYSPAQVRTGQLVGLLRGAGLSVAQIAPILADAATPTGGY